MEEMMEEYVTFHVTAKDGSDVESSITGKKCRCFFCTIKRRHTDRNGHGAD